METLNKIHLNPTNNSQNEEGYTTLDRIDFTDIGQAIDGNRSKPMDNFDLKKVRKNKVGALKSRRFWFW